MNTIGTRLKHYRELRQFDHKKLAAFTNISPADLAAIEDGTRALKHQELQVLARALEISTDDLFGNAHASGASAEGPSESSALIPASKLAALLDQMKE
jgi:transcriptional regulator with XRE-family HTH domain